MATDIANEMVSNKLDKNNFPTWQFIMMNFFVGKGNWEYIE